MATCANCIHHSLCDYNTNVSGNGKIRLVYAEGADVKCSFFQNTADVVQKSEVERLQAEVDQLHALLECGVFANSVEDWQKFLNEKRAEVAREIFAEIEKIRAKEIHKCEILRVQENEASERKYWEGGEHSLRQLSYWIAELKKKYMGGET